jgi:hypothetical protein
MAYCIFPKSLRSIEEFRKNLCVQIPSKSPCRNSQILPNFEIYLNSKIKTLRIFPIEISPGRHAGLPHSQAVVILVGPLGPRSPLAYFTEYVFFFDSRLSSLVPSLSPLADAWAPPVSSLSHPASSLPMLPSSAPRVAAFAP